MSNAINFFKESINLYIDPISNLVWKKPSASRWREVKDSDLENFKPGIPGATFFNAVTGESCLGDPREAIHIEGGLKIKKLAQYIFGSTFLSSFLAVSKKLYGHDPKIVEWITAGLMIGSTIGIFKSYEKERKEILVFNTSALPRF